MEEKEKLKCSNGLAKESLADEENNIIIQGMNDRKDIQISQKKLSSIIEARMIEIFHLGTKSFKI